MPLARAVRSLVAVSVAGLVVGLLLAVPAGPPASASSGESRPHAGAVERKVRTVTFRGGGRRVFLPSLGRDLRRTSASFRRFVGAEIKRYVRNSGGPRSCRGAVYVQVKRWRSDGFASIPAVSAQRTDCAAGGYAAIFVKRGKRWSSPSVLGGHEAPYCTDLLAFRVPRSIAERRCYDETGTALRTYDPDAPRPPATPTYAATTLVAAVRAGSPDAASRWASDATVARMFELRLDGAVWEVRECRDDHACVLRAEYFDAGPPPALPTYVSEWELPMTRGALGRWYGGALSGLGSS